MASGDFIAIPSTYAISFQSLFFFPMEPLAYPGYPDRRVDLSLYQNVPGQVVPGYVSTVLSSRVEVDDAYLGGQHPGGKAGRGSENKVPFVAAVESNGQRHPIRAVFDPVETFSNAEIAAWARRWLASSATVISDGLACFRALTEAGCVHEPQIVGTKRKSTGMACFAWVNILLSNLKTAISGTYHGFKFENYAHRYLAEAQYRFNRRFDLSTMLPRLLCDGATTGSRPENWLRLAEAWR